LIIGVAPPTVASKRSSTPFFLASSSSVRNRKANGPLLEVTTSRQHSRAVRMFVYPGSASSMFVGVISTRTS